MILIREIVKRNIGMIYLTDKCSLYENLALNKASIRMKLKMTNFHTSMDIHMVINIHASARIELIQCLLCVNNDMIKVIK